MDGAPRLSAEIARNKAYTVASFNGLPTHVWWPAIADDPALVHGITHTPRLVIFAGGVPGATSTARSSARSECRVVPADQDRAIAEAAAAAIGPRDHTST